MSNDTPELPAEIWGEIVKFSGLKSVGNLAKVSKQFKGLADADERVKALKTINAELVATKESVAKLKEKVKKWRTKYKTRFSSDDYVRVKGKLNVVADELKAIEVLSKSDPEVAKAVADKIKVVKTDLMNMEGEVEYIFDR